MNGLVVVRLDAQMPGDAVSKLAQQALSLAARGRYVCGVWEVPHAWGPQNPIEAWWTQAIVGAPAEREECVDAPETFFGNIAVRGYEEDPVRPVSTWHVAMFRKAGPSPRDRKSESEALRDAARLDSTACAFTRDYANNVWHLSNERIFDGITSRLARLLIWPDEAVIVLGPKGRARSFSARQAPCEDLVGVPEKQRYEWNRRDAPDGLEHTLGGARALR